MSLEKTVLYSEQCGYQILLHSWHTPVTHNQGREDCPDTDRYNVFIFVWYWNYTHNQMCIDHIQKLVLFFLMNIVHSRTELDKQKYITGEKSVICHSFNYLTYSSQRACLSPATQTIPEAGCDFLWRPGQLCCSVSFFFFFFSLVCCFCLLFGWGCHCTA